MATKTPVTLTVKISRNLKIRLEQRARAIGKRAGVPVKISAVVRAVLEQHV